MLMLLELGFKFYYYKFNISCLKVFVLALMFNFLLDFNSAIFMNMC
jgi:hypothetical protein